MVKWIGRKGIHPWWQGRISADENPTTDLIDGIIRFHVYVTPPAPAREIDFIVEYDPQYLETLFAA